MWPTRILKQLDSSFWSKIEVHLFSIFAPLTCTRKASAHWTANGFTDTRKNIAGRQTMHDCTSTSTRGVHVSRALLQKIKVRFFDRKLQLNSSQTRSTGMHTQR